MNNIKDFILDYIFIILFIVGIALFVIQYNHERNMQRTITEINQSTNNFNLVVKDKVDESNYYVGGGRVIAQILKSSEDSVIYINNVEFSIKDFYGFADFSVINPYGKYKKEEFITKLGTAVYYYEIES